MVDDPNSKRTYYTISGPSGNRGFVTRQGRQDRRRARKEITGDKNEITSFEQNYNNGQDITRRQLRDDNFLENLSEVQYHNSNDANLASDAVYPQIRDVELGNLEFKKRWSTNKKVFSPRIEKDACGPDQLRLFKRKSGYKTELKWNNGHNRVYNNRVKSNTEYDQVPEMKTQYAVPVPVRTETITETEPIVKSTPTSTSVDVKTTHQKPSLRQKSQTSSRPKSKPNPKPKSESEPKIITSPKTTSDTTRMRTGVRLIAPDGTVLGDTTYTDWVEK